MGADRLEALAARHNLKINYKPVDLLDVYSRSGGIPLGQRAQARQAYREAELKRWMRRLNVTINITPRYMCPNGDLASRFTIAADLLGYDVAALYKAILHAEWCEEQDISDPEVLRHVAENLSLPYQEIMIKAESGDIERLYRMYTDEAVANGVFGSPAYVYRGEVFWGQDRLDFLEEAVKAG